MFKEFHSGWYWIGMAESWTGRLGDRRSNSTKSCSKRPDCERARDGLALRERHPALPARPGVLGFGANEPVVAVLLHDVRAPAGHPAHGEDGRSEVGGN